MQEKLEGKDLWLFFEEKMNYLSDGNLICMADNPKNNKNRINTDISA